MGGQAPNPEKTRWQPKLNQIPCHFHFPPYFSPISGLVHHKKIREGSFFLISHYKISCLQWCRLCLAQPDSTNARRIMSDQTHHIDTVDRHVSYSYTPRLIHIAYTWSLFR